MSSPKKPGKKLGKKAMKKTKGGILIGLNQPTQSFEHWKIDLTHRSVEGGNIKGTFTL